MKPTFLFLAGAWHLPDYFDPVISRLSSAGYPALSVQPATLNSAPPALSFQPDADATRNTIIPLLEAGQDVIVVAHSYAGIYGTDAVGEILDSGAEYPGTIARLVYVAAYVPLEGESRMTVTYEAVGPELPLIDFIRLDAGGNLVLTDIGSEILYHDVPEPARSHYTSLLGKQPTACMTVPITHAAWRRVPSTYVYTTLDRSMGPAFQEFMVNRAKESGGAEAAANGGRGTRKEHKKRREEEKRAEEGKVVRPFSGELGEFHIQCGHTPFLAKTEEFVDILVEIGKSTRVPRE